VVFTAVPTDVRSPRFFWSATNVTRADRLPFLTNNPQTIHFDVSNLQPGQSRTSDVRVTVTDADGLTATALVKVKITALAPAPPDDPIDEGGGKPDSPPIRE